MVSDDSHSSVEQACHRCEVSGWVMVDVQMGYPDVESSQGSEWRADARARKSGRCYCIVVDAADRKVAG